MNPLPLILITNDDGVHASGIRYLWQALKNRAEVVVVAPETEQSAVGLSITTRHPLQIKKVKWPEEEAAIWSVNGTPADCVKLALNAILPRPPQLIVSGINQGTNAGRNVLYSGTAAAIIEGVLRNIPGIAFSNADYFNPCYLEGEAHIPSIVDYVLTHGLPPGTFLNVNFPQKMERKMKGIRLARQGKAYWIDNPEERIHPVQHSSYYWLGFKLSEFEEEMDSDIAYLKQGYATAVPIYVGDLTHHDHLEKNRHHFDAFFNPSLSPVPLP